jgi:hypothetical protein
MHPTTRRFIGVFFLQKLVGVNLTLRSVGCASSKRLLQWMATKLFLTVEVLEDRPLICFSKGDYFHPSAK